MMNSLTDEEKEAQKIRANQIYHSNLSRKEKAIAFFQEGYNCSQAVFAAFADIYGLDLEFALKISASFGGGMGRMREVCGACSGMFLVAGLETGTAIGCDRQGKMENYEVVRHLADEYKKMSGGSIICKELLGLAEKEDTAMPEKRTKEYYKKRPCPELIGEAAAIVERELFQKNAENEVHLEKVTTKEQIAFLAEKANEVWHEYFPGIITVQQVDYMVEKFQSVPAISKQMAEGYEYFLIHKGEQMVGYMGIHAEQERMFLSKLYVMKEHRGNGYAGKALCFLREYTKEKGLNRIYLTVNRGNESSIAIYKHEGFEVIEEAAADIGKGYVMDDYIMQLTLNQ